MNSMWTTRCVETVLNSGVWRRWWWVCMCVFVTKRDRDGVRPRVVVNSSQTSYLHYLFSIIHQQRIPFLSHHRNSRVHSIGACNYDAALKSIEVKNPDSKIKCGECVSFTDNYNIQLSWIDHMCECDMNWMDSVTKPWNSGMNVNRWEATPWYEHTYMSDTQTPPTPHTTHFNQFARRVEYNRLWWLCHHPPSDHHTSMWINIA